MYLTLHAFGRHIATLGEPPTDQEPPDLAWTLEHDHLRHMLDRAAAGEDPGMLLLEIAANAEYT